MKFSVLIAHYNNYGYFKQCYESLKEQTYQDFEIIVVDDCSTDDSFEKIQNYCNGDSRVKFFQNSENKGVGFTKRRCIEEAAGEICGFVDPDDALTEDALEISIKAYKENYIATYSQFYLCGENLNIIKKFEPTQKIKNKNLLFFNVKFEVAHFFTFKKYTYLETEGINAELTSAVDQDLYLKLYEKGDFYYIQRPLYLYRLHEKGVSQEKSKKEKLNANWDKVLRNTLKRRKITQLFGKNISEIESLQHFIFKKQNTFFKKIITKVLMLFKPKP